MKKENLIRMRNEIIQTLLNMKDIDELDKLEIELLQLNLLNPDDYESNRKVLQKTSEENKYKRYVKTLNKGKRK